MTPDELRELAEHLAPHINKPPTKDGGIKEFIKDYSSWIVMFLTIFSMAVIVRYKISVELPMVASDVAAQSSAISQLKTESEVNKSEHQTFKDSYHEINRKLDRLFERK